MTWIVIRSVLFGLAGAIVAPVAVFFLVLVLAHAFDPRCGSPGDSGGCEMGAATLGFAAAPFGLIAGFVISLVLGLRSRKRSASLPGKSASLE